MSVRAQLPLFAGKWVIDPIHDGVSRDLIATHTPPGSPRGFGYVIMASGNRVQYGHYEDGVPRAVDGVIKIDGDLTADRSPQGTNQITGAASEVLTELGVI